MPRVIERTIYKLHELSEQVKRQVRDEQGRANTNCDWWDSTYTDAVAVLKTLGIDVSRQGRHLRLFFSGFGSQGDGASFAGYYKFNPTMVEDLAAYAPKDETLKQIAADLFQLQLQAKLFKRSYIEAEITLSDGPYVHSGVMDCKAIYGAIAPFIDDNDVSSEHRVVLLRVFKRLADWIYAQLEKEYDWLYSAECIDEQLADCEFDESGELI